MTRRRINLHIDRVTVSGGQISEQALAEAIRVELGMRLHGPDGGELLQRGRLVGRLDAGAANAGESREIGAGVGQAVGRATVGVLKR